MLVVVLKIKRLQVTNECLKPAFNLQLATKPVTQEADSAPIPYLTDTFGRQHTYLRISVTERCNLRCEY